MTNFDVQTGYGGLKVSEFDQEFISELWFCYTDFDSKKVLKIAKKY